MDVSTRTSTAIARKLINLAVSLDTHTHTHTHTHTVMPASEFQRRRRKQRISICYIFVAFVLAVVAPREPCSWLLADVLETIHIPWLEVYR